MVLVTSAGTILHRSTGAREFHDSQSSVTSGDVDEGMRAESGEELHSLGLFAHGTGRNRDAVNFMLRAIASCPDEPIYYNNCGEASASEFCTTCESL
jgi:hypothetical protein